MSTPTATDYVMNYWEKVQDNLRRLETCPRHDFSTKVKGPPGDGFVEINWRCSRCGGVVPLVMKHWYELGLKHAETPHNDGQQRLLSRINRLRGTFMEISQYRSPIVGIQEVQAMAELALTEDDQKI